MYTDLEQTSAGLGQRGRKPYLGEGLRELQPRPPPPFGEVFDLSSYPCLSLFNTKNNIINS